MQKRELRANLKAGLIIAAIVGLIITEAKANECLEWLKHINIEWLRKESRKNGDEGDCCFTLGADQADQLYS